MRVSSRNLVSVIGVAILLIAAFVIFCTPLLDYLYLRHILGKFEAGLNQINWVNPYLGKSVVLAFSSAITWVYYKHHSIGHHFISLKVLRLLLLCSGGALLLNIILTFATWGNLLDNLGNSHLKYVVGDNGVVRIFTDDFVRDPVYGYTLIPITADNARYVNLLLQTKFSEIFDPKPNDWFTLNGFPKIFYSVREDGLHLFNLPVCDPYSSKRLIPASADVITRWYKEHPQVSHEPTSMNEGSAISRAAATPVLAAASASPKPVLETSLSPSRSPNPLDDVSITVSPPLEIVYQGRVLDKMEFCSYGPFLGLFHWKGALQHFVLTPPNGLLRNSATGQWEAPFQKFLMAHPDLATKLGDAYVANHPECRDPFHLQFKETPPHRHEGQYEGAGIFEDKQVRDGEGHTILLRRDPVGRVFVVHYETGFNTQQLPPDIRQDVLNYLSINSSK